jgi:TonB-linked SusC/RagA family outer membrane protein
MKKIILTMLFGLGIMLGAVAQNRTITGKVVDEKGNGLSGATIQQSGSNKAKTEGDGTFTITVPSTTKSLVISYVGYQPQTVSIATSTNVLVKLALLDTKEEEVVVVGYGSAKKAKEVVGSVKTVSAKKIQEMPTANALDALQGKVAGLQVYTSSGEPSAISSTRINGVGSLTAGTTPLYVLDGVPISSGATVSLNPQDYESVSVLTDASSTSIYGSRAANGVIYFTTKKGSASRARISINSQYATSSLTSNTTNFFGTAMNTKELTDFWLAVGYRTPASLAAQIAASPNASLNNDTKWSSVYYRDRAPSKQIDLSISGGGDKTTYYISGAYFFQDGLTYRSAFKRYTLRGNINSVVNKWLTTGINLVGGYDNRQLNPYGSNSTNRGLGLLAQPFYSPTNPATGQNYELIPGWGRYHPNYLQDKIQSNSDNVQFTPSGYIQITPIKNLILKTQAGMEAYDFTTSTIQLPSFIGSLNNGSVAETYIREVTRTITTTAEYKFNIKKKHGITLLAGNEFIDDKFKSFNGSSTGQTDDRLLLIGAGPNNRNASSSKSAYSYLSYFGRTSYNYNSKYYLDLTARNDQSSRFGKDNRSANFWSIGGMWKAKSEKFLENVNWLSDLTLKASIGTSGNSAIGNYQSLAVVGTNQFDALSGFGIGSPGNPNLAWEKQKLSSLGVNFSIKNRVNVNLEYYTKLTTNMLLDVPFPLTTGFSTVTSNVGGLKNWGYNVTIDADVYRKQNAYITPYVNFNYNQMKVTELFQNRNYWIQQGTGVSWIVGQSVNYLYPIFSGVNPTTGNPEWYNPNSNPDLIINTQKDGSNVTSTFNSVGLQQNTGIKRYPPLTGGFGLSASARGFYTQIDFSFAKGKYLINNDRYFYENPNQFPGFNQSRTILDYWKKPGDVAKFPKYGVQFTQFDTRLIEDASFMRMKNFTIGYNVPSNLLKKSNFLTGCKFYLTGRNLLTVTKYTGPDPEIDTNVTLGANPNTRQIAVGLDFQF